MSVSLFLKDPASARYVAGGRGGRGALRLAAARPAGTRDRRGPRGLHRPRALAPATPAAAVPGVAARADRRPDHPHRGQRTGPGRVRSGPRPNPPLGEDRRPSARPAQPVLAGPHPGRGRVPAGAGDEHPGPAPGQVLASPAAAVLLPPRRPGLPGARGRGQTASGENPSLVASIIDDGFAFTETQSPSSTSTTSWPRTSATASPPRPSSRSSRSWCARRRGGCARATGRCSPGWRATCRCCPASTTSSPAASCGSS